MSTIKDILGERFGRWTVMDYVGTNSRGNPIWLCQCDCGTWKELTHYTLLVKKSKSCGCESRKVKLNDYILTDDVCKCILSTGEHVLFDREDYPKIAQHKWSKSGGYACTIIDGHNVRFHRLIIDCPEKMLIDHINRNRLDNRKCNLRICTTMQNNWNAIYPRFNGGHRGVIKLNRTNKWLARINVNYECIILGRYNSFEEAVEARLKAEKFYFGEFAPKD